MKKFFISAALIGAAFSQPAHAVKVVAPTPTVFFENGSDALPFYTTAAVFQDFSDVKKGAHLYKAEHGTLATGGTWQETVTPFDVSIKTSSDSELLLPIANAYEVTFSKPQQYFSLFVESLSSATTITLGFANGTTKTLSGLNSFGIQGNFFSIYNGRLNFDMTGQSGIDSFLIKSNIGIIAIGGLAAAAPEPATWAMMILGFGMIGSALRRSRRTGVGSSRQALAAC